MRLYLVQHGEAVVGLSAIPGLGRPQTSVSGSEAIDRERPLSPKGLRDAATLAAACKPLGLGAAEVMHSGKLRARQTAEALAEGLGLPVRQVAGIDPLSPVRPFALDCASRASAVIVVGHLPFMERLASLLVTGREEPPIVVFQNAGMLCLELSAPPSARSPGGVWRILWTAFPVQPRMGA